MRLLRASLHKAYYSVMAPKARIPFPPVKKGWGDLLILALLSGLVIGFVFYGMEFFGPIHKEVKIELSTVRLPEYAFFSFSRAIVAYAFSFVFSLVIGFWAAKDRAAEKVIIPLLDILQSIPILGFMPGVVLLLVSLFSKTNIGLELAAIILMFTSQAWNMAFGVYQSVRTVPEEKEECATIYKINYWKRVRWVEFPCTIHSLVWNSIMSVAGGWFFLMVNEAFKLGDRNFQIPGLGSFMSVAAARRDIPAMIEAIVMMVLLIIFIDQFIWRPLVVWSQKFRVEETAPTLIAESWFLNVLKNSYLVNGVRLVVHGYRNFIQNRKAKKVPEKKSIGSIFLVISRAFLLVLIALLVAAAFYLFFEIRTVSFSHWLYLGKMFLLTFGRVIFCLVVSVLVGLPLGLMIGLSEKLTKILQPLIQITASFPATLLFPIIIYILMVVGIPLGYGSMVLMLTGSIWYVFFNVIAGARALPSDLREVAANFHYSLPRRFISLYLPGIFPFFVTGLVNASGGAWNASIVAEYVTYKQQVYTTPGLGSAISMAAQEGNIPNLVASVLVMMVIVACINYNVWLRIYHYSEKRFALNY